MGESSPHKGGSPGQDHSQEQRPGIGAPDRGNTGDSRAGNVSDGNVGARVCQSKGVVPWGNRCMVCPYLKIMSRKVLYFKECNTV